MIKCHNLKKIYDKKTVVNNLSFNINKGEIFALLGSNGAGKTTTIKMILGLINIDGGSINKSIDYIGYSPETPYFPKYMTAFETMKFYYKLQNLDKGTMKPEIDNLLLKVGLSEFDSKRVGGFSKGMLQRLAVAQSLIGSPEIIILDEPTAGLDAFGRIEMIDLIKELNSEGKTIILNSHILNDVEKIAHRGIIMKKGEIMTTWEKTSLTPEKSLEEIFIEAIGGRKVC